MIRCLLLAGLFMYAAAAPAAGQSVGVSAVIVDAVEPDGFEVEVRAAGSRLEVLPVEWTAPGSGRARLVERLLVERRVGERRAVESMERPRSLRVEEFRGEGAGGIVVTRVVAVDA